MHRLALLQCLCYLLTNPALVLDHQMTNIFAVLFWLDIGIVHVFECNACPQLWVIMFNHGYLIKCIFLLLRNLLNGTCNRRWLCVCCYQLIVCIVGYNIFQHFAIALLAVLKVLIVCSADRLIM